MSTSKTRVGRTRRPMNLRLVAEGFDLLVERMVLAKLLHSNGIKIYCCQARRSAANAWWSHEEVGHTDEAQERDSRLLDALHGGRIRSRLSQKGLFSESSKSPPTPATSSSIPSPVPAPPARSRTRWVAAGSWWSWASIATRTSFRACKR